jgi:hypothetical protein
MRIILKVTVESEFYFKRHVELEKSHPELVSGLALEDAETSSA